MNAIDLLELVREAGGQIKTAGDHLQVTAPEPLPDDLMAEIRAHKPELLRLLSDRPPCSGCCNLRMAEVPTPGERPPYRFVWGCAKGHLEHGHTTPDLRGLVASDSCLMSDDHEPAFRRGHV